MCGSFHFGIWVCEQGFSLNEPDTVICGILFLTDTSTMRRHEYSRISLKFVNYFCIDAPTLKVRSCDVQAN